MSDADCTPGREARSVAASPLLNFDHFVLLFVHMYFSLFVCLLWPPYVIGGHYIFAL